MATKTHPAGSIISYDVDGVDPFTDIGDLVSIKPPSEEFGVADITPLEDSSKVRHFLQGWEDAGEVSFTTYMTKAQVSALDSLKQTQLFWKILFPLIEAETVNSELLFEGFFIGIDWQEVSKDSDDVFMVAYTIKLTAGMTFTPGS